MVASWASRDRRRTHAISLYLADHRDEFIRKLPGASGGLRKEAKRNELLRLARRAFHIEAPEVQRRYYQKETPACGNGCGRRRLRGKQANPASGGVGASAGTSGSAEASGGGVLVGTSGGAAGTSGGIQTPSGVEAIAPQTPPVGVRSRESSPIRGEAVVRTLTSAQAKTGDIEATTPSAQQQTLASGDVAAPAARRLVTPSWMTHFELRGTVPEAKVHSCIVSNIVYLRKFYGDIAAADVFCASLRFLYQFGPELGLTAERGTGARSQLLQDRTSCQVQTAAILGLAVKKVLAQECTDKVPVSRLWLKVAGNSNVARVQALEIRLLNLWPVP